MLKWTAFQQISCRAFSPRISSRDSIFIIHSKPPKHEYVITTANQERGEKKIRTNWKSELKQSHCLKRERPSGNSLSFASDWLRERRAFL